jgi:hypothetical protein
LQMQQLSELQQLHEAGLLPGYADAELSGLGLEELDDMLVSQLACLLHAVASSGPKQNSCWTFWSCLRVEPLPGCFALRS